MWGGAEGDKAVLSSSSCCCASLCGRRSNLSQPCALKYQTLKSQVPCYVVHVYVCVHVAVYSGPSGECSQSVWGVQTSR